MSNNKHDINATTFYINLLNGNIDEAFRILSIYLRLVDKHEYEFLLVRLVRLDVLYGDPAFYKTMIALTEITTNNFVFSIDYYLKKFNESVNSNNYEMAILYLNIITRTKTLGFVISNDLRNKLYLEIEKIKPIRVNGNSFFGESKAKVERIYNLLDQGFSLERACSTLGQGKNSYRILALVLARDSYLVGDYEKGDFFLKKVEKAKNMPKFLVKLYNEVKGRRNFYINDRNNALNLKKK